MNNAVRNLSTNFVAKNRYEIAIIGGGVAGLSCASALASVFSSVSSEFRPNITVFEKKEKNNNSGRNIGVGLWSNSLQNFGKYCPDIVRELVDVGRWVGPVSYRTISGDFLAESHLNDSMVISKLSGLLEDNSSTYNEYGNMPGLLFVNENELYSILHRDLEESTRSNLCSIVYGQDITEVEIESRKCFGNKESDGGVFDLIIVANGANSKLRKIGRIFDTKDGWKPRDRGYTVFRGNSLLDLNARSFQTWGENNGMRFASCPLKHGHVWFATINNESILHDLNDTYETKAFLLDHFSTWHSPIQELIESTSDKTILFEKAVAHMERGVNVVIPETPHFHFVGDADICLDPLLSQGFSLAFEDASYLSRSMISHFIDRNNPSSLNRIDSGMLHSSICEPLLEQFSVKQRRVDAVLHSTTFAQALAQPSGPMQVFLAKNVRFIMGKTPNMISKPVFNYIMKYSLGIQPF